MTWFKENKFLAGLILITTLVAALLVFFGMGSGKKLETVKADIEAAKADLKKKKSLDPFPTIENAKAKEESLKAVIKSANEAREKLIAFRPAKLDNVSGKEFSENLAETVDKVKELFPGEDGLPNGFHLGFEPYAVGLPKEEATGVLTYQLGAMEYLFNELAQAGVQEVMNLHRAKLPAENGEPWPDAVGGKPGARPRGGRAASRGRPAPRGRTTRGRPGARGARPKAPAEVLPPVAHRMPIELSFKGPEIAVREFLTKLANSDQYFFEARLARVKNPSPIPTAGKSAAAAKPKDDFGGDLEIIGDDPVDSGDSDEPARKILDKVSGGDELVVFLRADLLLFIDEQKFPELK